MASLAQTTAEVFFGQLAVHIGPGGLTTSVTTGADGWTRVASGDLTFAFAPGFVNTIGIVGSAAGGDTILNGTGYTTSVMTTAGNNTVTPGAGFNLLYLGGDNNTYDTGGHTSMVFTYGVNNHITGANLFLTSYAATAGLADGGFEQPGVDLGSYVYAPVGSAWTFVGAAGVSGNKGGFTLGNPVAPEGLQVAFLQKTGSISQEVRGMAAGSYKLTFAAAQRGNWQASAQDFRVTVDGVPVGTFKPTGTDYLRYSTDAFRLDSAAHTIAFEGLDTSGGDNTAFIDDVRLEPAA